jgi:hypothetical protein
MTREGREAGTRKPVASGVCSCDERERESLGRTASGKRWCVRAAGCRRFQHGGHGVRTEVAESM